MRRFAQRLGVAAIVALVFAGAGCGKNVFEPEVENRTDDFRFTLDDADDVTEVQSITWRNDGPFATVIQDSRITGGHAQLLLLDAAGTQVYAHDLAARDTFTTSPAGASGVWTVRLQLSDVDGDVVFRLLRLDGKARIAR
jgi:hypothetical protein